MKGIIFISLAVGTLIIGIHQAMVNGIVNSYWIFMFAVCFLLLYKYTGKKGALDAPEEENEGKKKIQEKGIAGEGKLARKIRRRKRNLR